MCSFHVLERERGFIKILIIRKIFKFQIINLFMKDLIQIVKTSKEISFFLKNEKDNNFNFTRYILKMYDE
jgi:hypothetical protein